MNAEKLHRIIYEIQSDLNENSILDKFKSMRDHLQNQINQPQQPAHQNDLVASLEELYDLLDSICQSFLYNSFSHHKILLR